jgi:hypothetical protein
MRIALCSALCLSVAAVACARSGDRKVDSAAGTVAATPAASPDVTPAAAPSASASTIALKDVAGTWHVVATPTEGKDTTPTTTTLMATGDTTGWTTAFTGRKPVPVHVRADGDSIMTMSGPYESIRRKGVQVTTNSVYRMKGDKLVGTTVAHYQTRSADSVLHLRAEATRAP